MRPRPRSALIAGLVTLGATIVFGAETSSTPDAPAKRAAFLQLIDRPEVPLDPQVGPPIETEGVVRTTFSFATEAGQRVPGIMVHRADLPRGLRHPVVIALHGTGGNKDSSDVRAILDRVVPAGFVGVAIDGRHHGERIPAGSGAAAYNAAIVQTWRQGGSYPFFYDTVWDVMGLIDFLETRKDLDATRIGVIGFSKGGIETYLAAAADPRIACAVPCIGVQSFGWALQHGQWKARIATIQDAFDQIAALEGEARPGADFVRRFYAKVVPGIDGEFDGPAMLPLIAPRPLLVINSDSDANTPIAGVRLSVEAARPAYASAGANEKLLLRVQENTAHRVTPESLDEATAWFVRWLKSR